MSIGNGFGENVIIFGVDMSSYVHVDNKKKDILILAEGPTQLQKKNIQLILLSQGKNVV